MGKLTPELSAKVKLKLQYWANQLRDISGRNRLLFWKDTKASSGVITEPDLFSVFERIVIKAKPLTVPLPDEEKQQTLFDNSEDSINQTTTKEIHQLGTNECASDKSTKQFNNTLKNLRYKSRTIREEQGFNALYMAFGMLRWQEAANSEFCEAPIVLVPIDIERGNVASPFTLSMFEDEIVVNPTLQAHLKSSFAIEFPDISQDISTDDLRDYLSLVESMVVDLKWAVIQKVVIGIFNFQTLMIIKDLEKNADHFIESPIIQMLSGLSVEQSVDYENVPTAEELDNKVDPLSVYQILDADSSQQEAIEAAKRGVSLVLQGPPGTGKSQTIANIIAESLAADKKVLFVSQKAAALEVVKARLDNCGLGDFCLEVHSHNKDKKDVIDNLAKSLVNGMRVLPQNTSGRRLELANIRSKLNSYVQALHKPRFQLGLTLYYVQGKLAELLTVPILNFSLQNLDTVSSEQFHKYLLLIKELVTYENPINNYKNHPWKGIALKTITLKDKEEILNRFEAGAEDISNFQEMMKFIAGKYELAEPQTLRDGIKLLKVISIFDAAIFTEEYSAIVDRFEKKYKSNFRYFSIQYWKDSSALAKIHRQQKRVEPKNLERLLNYVSEIRTKSIEMGLNPIVGPSLNEQGLTKRTELNNKIIDLIAYSKKIFDKNETPPILESVFDAAMSALSDWFHTQAQQVDDIVDWVNFNNLIIEAESIGLGDFINQSLINDLEPELWELAFMRRFYLLLTDLMVQSDKALSQFRSSAHNNLIEQFRKLDKEIIEVSKTEIQSRLQQARPESTWIHAQSAETTILKREANKKRRIKPLRILFKEIPNLLLLLRPCVMMSPLTVSQLLDPDVFQFDIAIFDEASQIPPEYAIGTFMRANQVIIAGDRHQLPPTRFFQVLETDEFGEEDYDIDEFESILHACDSINIPNKMLLWHYRSQDESLIAFSNYQFYDNKLLTFPNVDSSRSTTGLEFIYVPDGIYKRGYGARYNLIEARRVAQLVIEQLRSAPELSIGVVTFSQSQREVIENEIDRLKKENPELYPLFTYQRTEPFFVKNLENVQGDERDIIIFSVGYGKDETGTLSMNFGPLNRLGGERRLNVAITRARIAVKLVASFEPEDIDLTKTDSRGPHLLRSYMKTARDGVSAIYEGEIVNPNAEFESPFEEAVYNALTSRGIKLIKQVGVSKYRIDFGVVDPDKPGACILGIECDGATYHSSPTARDRDRLRQQLLQEKYGWRIHRIWSRDWITDQMNEINKVFRAIDENKKNVPEKAIKNSEGKPEPNNGIPTNNVSTKNTQEGISLGNTNTQVYRKASLKKRLHGGAVNFHNTSYDSISKMFIEIVEIEGPIHRDVAKRRVADAYGVKIGTNVDLGLNIAIGFAEKSGKIKIDGLFLLPQNMKEIPLRLQKNGEPERKVEEIYPQELDAAIIECVRNSLSISRGDLVIETAKLFNLRATKNVSEYIQPRITHLLRTKKLKVKLDKIVLANS